MVVLRQRLDMMISEIFSNLTGSVNIFLPDGHVISLWCNEGLMNDFLEHY